MAVVISSKCHHGLPWHCCEVCWPARAETIYRVSRWNAAWSKAKRDEQKSLGKRTSSSKTLARAGSATSCWLLLRRSHTTMRSKFGTLLTPARLRLMDHYRRSRNRSINSPRLSRAHYFALRAWVESFDDFMCKGWDLELRYHGVKKQTADAQPHDPGLSPQDTRLDGGEPTGHAR